MPSWHHGSFFSRLSSLSLAFCLFQGSVLYYLMSLLRPVYLCTCFIFLDKHGSSLYKFAAFNKHLKPWIFRRYLFPVFFLMHKQKVVLFLPKNTLLNKTEPHFTCVHQLYTFWEHIGGLLSSKRSAPHSFMDAFLVLLCSVTKSSTGTLYSCWQQRGLDKYLQVKLYQATMSSLLNFAYFV